MSTNFKAEELNAHLPLMIRSAAMMFIEAAKYLDENYGLEGRMVLRKATRDVGIWRGNQLRKAHKALGYPINMDSLCNYWDSASATKHVGEIWRTQGKWHPCNVEVPIPFIRHGCESADVWSETDDWMLGHIYCDEFHINFVKGYHPEAAVVIPECIMKGDPQCNFRFMVAADAPLAEDLPLYPGEKPEVDWQGEGEEKVLGELRRKARITLGRMYFLFAQIKEAYPDQYKTIFTDIMKRWTQRRVEDERAKSEDLAIEKTPYNLFKNLDTPYESVWGAKLYEDSGDFTMEINYCPYLETWDWLGDGKDLTLFCDHCYKDLIEGYNENYQGNLEKCMAKGDRNCKITAKRKQEE